MQESKGKQMADYEKPITTENLIEKTGFSRQKIWRLQKSEVPFPKPFGRDRWLWSEVIAWQEAMKAKRDFAGVIDIRRKLEREADLVLIDHLTRQVAEVRQRLASY